MPQLRSPASESAGPAPSNSESPLADVMKRDARSAAGKSKAKRGGRRPMDPRVEDLRKKILFLNPYSGWIPKGARQRIVNIVDHEGDIVGELETGDDGFVQVAVVAGKQLVRISYYPGRNHATLARISLRD